MKTQNLIDKRRYLILLAKYLEYAGIDVVGPKDMQRNIAIGWSIADIAWQNVSDDSRCQIAIEPLVEMFQRIAQVLSSKRTFVSYGESLA